MWIFSIPNSPSTSPNPARRNREGARPTLEVLESRCLLSAGPLTPLPMAPQGSVSSVRNATEGATARPDDGQHPSQTYLALGDSIAFGETNVFPRTYGDQGYVTVYADWLATQNHGARPKVINLAVIGETSATYFDVNAPGIAPHAAAAAFNLNYTNPTVSQEQMLRATIAAEAAAGHVITHVSFALGINDFAYLQQTHPELPTLPPAQQQALIDQAFAGLALNDIRAVAEIRA